MRTAVMFSSESPEWATPQDFFDALDSEFHFTLDPCCTHENAKCVKHYTIEENGLAQNWGGRQSFAILLMDENCPNGYANAMKNRDEQRW